MSVDQILDEGFTAYNAGHLEIAEESARHVLSLQPTHGDALYLLALIATQAKAYEKASEILYNAIKLYPKIESYQLLLASVLEKLNRFDEALEIFQKYPNQVDALVQSGYIYLKRNQFSFALESFEKALTLYPDYSEALLGLAALYQKMNKPYIPLLKKILKQEENYEAYYRLSLALYDQKKYQQALDKIQRALKLSEDAETYNQEGLCYEALKEFQLALDSYEKSIQLNPYYDLAYLNKANVLSHLKEYGLSEKTYRQAIVQNPKNFDAFYCLGLLLFKQNRYVEALENLRSALLLKPNDIEALYALAIAVEQTHDYLEAIGLYFNILSLGGKKKGLSNRLKTCILNLSKINLKQAQEFVSGWLKNFPDNKTAQKTLMQLQKKS